MDIRPLFLAAEARMSDKKPELRDLLQRIKQGDEEAATNLVNLYADLLRTVIQKELARRAGIGQVYSWEDVRQDAWASIIRVIRERHPYKTDAQLTVLFKRIARDKVKKAIRTYRNTLKRDLGTQVSLDGMKKNLMGPACDPAKIAERRDLIDWVLQRFPLEHRLVFRMHFQKFTNREIAYRLGWSEETVRRILFVILFHLGKYLNLAS